MPFGRAFALVQLTALGLAAAGANGPTAVRIEFEGPADCSDADRFYARVRARTERVRKAGPGEAALRLRVRLQPPASGKVHGELRIVDERGEAATRSVDGASCEEVVEALSLTAALALDPTATLTASPAPASSTAAATNGNASGGASSSAAGKASTTPAAAASSGGSAAAATVAKPAAAEQTPTSDDEGANANANSRMTVGGELGAGLLLTRVVSPHLNYGAQAFGRLTLRAGERTRASLGLGLAYSGNDLLAASAELSLRLTSVSLQVCPRRFGDELSLELCALGSGGLLVATGRGVSDPTSARRSYFTLGALARAALAVGARVRLELEAGAFAPLVYRDYVLSSPERLLGETPGFSAMGALGASYGF